MHTIKLDDYIKENHLEFPDRLEFQKISDEFAYAKIEEGSNDVTNVTYERGILEYGLVKKHNPTNVFEFGTAAGFSALCMALAMNQNQNNGTIFTIDYISKNKKVQHYYKNQNKIQVKNITRHEHWKKSEYSYLFDMVRNYDGYSNEVIAKNTFPKMQFFNDDISGSFYEGVKNDFFSSLMLSDNKSQYLFNTYADTPFGIGVKKFVDEEIAPNFNTELIIIDKSEYWIKRGVTNSAYGMCLVEINRDEMIEHFGLKNIEKFQQEYNQLEKRLKLRSKINEKVPFLKKIRFGSFLKS